ncbi:MAG: zinc metallopeptidase [Thermoflexibacter sp.]
MIFDTGYMLIAGIVMLVSWAVSATLKSKFRNYSMTPISSGMSGAEVAANMLDAYGIRGVRITCVEGTLTDHYNPTDYTINLSPDVYYGRNAAAAAVAAHETGHAVQHAKAYSFLQLRSAIVPAVSFVSPWIGWVLIAGLFMLESAPWVMLIGISMFALTTLFSFVTLPVEFDASRRALEWIKHSRVVNSQEYAMSKDALWWAAMTYVVAALGSLATLMYYIMLFLGRRD